MKKAIDIIAESKKNSNEIKTIDELLKKAPYSVKKIDAELVEKESKRFDLIIANRILHDNARRALYEEVMPIAIDIINQYAGKAYGEKTKEKIRQALIEKTNCSVYITHSYSDSITIVPLNKDGFSGTYFKYDDFEIYTKYVDGECASLLIDNKIQRLTMEMLYLSDCAEYVENVNKRVKDIKKAFNAAQEAEKALDNACKEFNALLPKQIDHLSAAHMRNYIYSAWN